MNDFSESTGIVPLQGEPVDDIRIFVREDAGRLRFNNVPPDPTSAQGRNDVIPGRGDLRISLTSACNLRCSYCHNEGQEAPWLHAKTSAMLGNIEKLLEIASRHGVKSVKFSGGDPGVYPGFFMLMDAVAGWRQRYPGIAKWGMCTNGVPFVDADTVFTGEKLRTLNVVRAARRLGVNVSVVEINGVMGTVHTVRSKFLELIAEAAEEFRLEPRRYKPLNEIYLYDKRGNTPIKFYQDHCRDLDCGNCRKIHLRVSPIDQGWGAVPCFLRAQSKTIPLMVDGKFDDARFEDAIKYNGQGSQWFKDTPYDPSY